MDTLVYDAARDAGGWLAFDNVAAACIVVGIALLAIPTIMSIRRQPERRVRGLVRLGAMVVLAAALVIGLRMLDSYSASTARTESVEGVIGSITPKLLTVGGLKVMYSCADTAYCPGVIRGDRARVAYVDDSGPETSALAVRIWKLSGSSSAR